MSGVISSAVFIQRFISNDLESVLYALLQVSASFAVLYMLAIALFFRKKIKDFFDKLTDIYSARKNTHFTKILLKNFYKCLISLNLDANQDTFQFLAKANDKSEWMWRIYSKYTLVLLFFGLFTSVVSYLLAGGFYRDKLFTPYRLVWVEIPLMFKKIWWKI